MHSRVTEPNFSAQLISAFSSLLTGLFKFFRGTRLVKFSLEETRLSGLVILTQATSSPSRHPFLSPPRFPFSCEVLPCGPGLVEPPFALTFPVTETDMNCSSVSDPYPVPHLSQAVGPSGRDRLAVSPTPTRTWARAEPTLRALPSSADGVIVLSRRHKWPCAFLLMFYNIFTEQNIRHLH